MTSHQLSSPQMWHKATQAAANDFASILLPSAARLPTIALLLLVLTLSFFILFRSKIWGKNKSLPLPPGPKPWPIVGNLPELFINKPRFRWIHRLMKELNTDIACIRLGNVHVIPVTCPEIAREFLKEQDATFASRPITMATEHVSRGFVSMVVVPWNDQWKKMRKLVATEVLSSYRIRWLYEKRLEEADSLVRYIYNLCKGSCGGGAVVNVRTIAWHYNGNAIRNMFFGKRFFGKGSSDGGHGIEEEEHIHAIDTTLSHVTSFCVSDYMPCLRWFDLDGHEKIIKKAMGIVDKYHDPIIDERIKQWRDEKRKEPEDLLDVLISIKDAHGKPLLSTDEIKAQTTELVFAAVDNPSNAIEWALAEMINKPEILRKAVDEIDKIVGKDRLVQESDFPKLNYIKACAREAFRLHPFAPFNLPHVSMADTAVAGYFIPKGSHVLLSRPGLGRNPKVWDDPLRFNPDRHLKDDSTQVELAEPELRFISFSTGRRGCLGVTLGSLLTIMLFARLLQGFDWSLAPGELSVELIESIHSLSLSKPLHLYAKPRLPLHLYSKGV